MNNKKPSLSKPIKRWFSWSGLAVLMLVIVCLVGSVLLMTPPDEVQALQDKVRGVMRIGVFIQIAVATLIVINWPSIILYGNRKGLVQTHEVQQLIKSRKLVAMALTGYMLLFPVGPAAIVHFFVSQ